MSPGLSSTRRISTGLRCMILRLDILSNREDAVRPQAASRNVHSGHCALLLKFEGVDNQVLKHLGDQHGIDDDGGKRIGGNFGLGFFDGALEVIERVPKDVTGGNRAEVGW